MMEVTLTCQECGSGIHIHPNQNTTDVACPICQTINSVKFNAEHEDSIVKDCPKCERKRFLSTKRLQPKNWRTSICRCRHTLYLDIWTKLRCSMDI